MKICIFGAASNEIDSKYIELVEKLGKELAEAGHELVFGAGLNGLMGASARGFRAGGGKITGVIPRFFDDERIEAIYEDCDELIFTDTMQERKKKMEDISDAFIVVPGGIGTFEEFFEVLTLKQLGRHQMPIALYNIDGYFDNLMEFMEHCTDEGFIKRNCRELYLCTGDCAQMVEYINKKEPMRYSIRELKNG